MKKNPTIFISTQTLKKHNGIAITTTKSKQDCFSSLSEEIKFQCKRFLIRRYQGAIMLDNLKMYWKFLINFSAITNTELWSLNYVKIKKKKKKKKKCRKELIFTSRVFFNILLWNTDPPPPPHAFKLLVKIVLTGIFEINRKVCSANIMLHHGLVQGSQQF